MSGHFTRAALIAAGFSLFAAASAQAQTAKDFNVFVAGDYTGYNVDAGGKIAAGGNVSLTNYGAATALGATTDDTLIVGGKLTTQNFQLYQGNAVAGSLALGSGTNFHSGTVRTGAATVDFVSEMARLNSISQSLSSMANVGTVDWNPNTYTLTGSDAALNVFNISGANLSGTNTLIISAPTGAQVLINVDGNASGLNNMGFSLKGISASNILFNFSQATTLQFGGVGIKGSILAPNANIAFSNGHIDGSMFANSVSGGGEFHNILYSGTLLNTAAVPEPASWALMITGFGAIGGVLRRKRRVAALA